MGEALVNPPLVQWALDRSGLEKETVAKRLGVPLERLEAWVDGDSKPTVRQASMLASVLSVPIGYLYLREPPAEDFPIPDFRTVQDASSRVDANTRDLLKDIQFKRDWFEDYRIANGFDKLSFVGKFSIEDSNAEISEDIRSVLGSYDPELFAHHFSTEVFLTRMMAAVESAGVWVMRSSVVGNNTHRALSVNAFRGFAISNDILPIVFINGADAVAAQVFTLAHELCHIWIGSTDINSTDLEKLDFGAKSKVEVKCNAVAAEFLLPEETFRAQWRSGLPLTDQISLLAARFSVSRIVIARRASDLGLVPFDEYHEFFRVEQTRWSRLRRSPGGDFYRTIPVRNGRTFTNAVVREAMKGSMLLRDASRLLGVKPAKIRNLGVSA